MDTTQTAEPMNAIRENGNMEFRRLLDKLPTAAYLCDANGLITYFNERVTEMWGRAPRLHDPLDRYCGSFKLFSMEGSFIPHDQCWMAMALNTGKEYNGMEVAIERPDGSRRFALVHISPYFDESGKVTGALNVLVDITGQKQFEQRLHQSEQDLADFFENAVLGLHWVGPDGIILRANRTELDLLGYSVDEYVGHHITEFHVDQDVIHEILCHLQAGKEVREREARLRCKDGSIKHVLINSNVLWQDGKFIHTRCFTRDISYRKHIEAAHAQLNDQLAAELADTQRLQEISTQLIQENDVNALYHRLLDAAMSIMKSDKASMQMMDEREDGLRLLAYRGFDSTFGTTFDLVTPDTRTSCSMARRVGQRVIIPDITAYDFIASTPALQDHLKAGIRAVQSTPLISRNGQMIGMISTHWSQPHQPTERDLLLLDILARQAADLLERKKTEQVLRESEERYRSLVSIITDVPWTTDAAGAFVQPQKSWQAYTGQSWDEHKDFGWINALHPDDRTRVASAWRRACQNRGAYESHGRLWHMPSRQWRYYVARATPLLNPDGSVREWVGSCTDVDEATRAAQTLKEADRRKDEFLATLAHELRNPLAPIRNAVQIMRLAQGDGEIAEQARQTIERQLQQMVRLVDDLLDVSRITCNKIELRKERVALSSVVQSAVEISRPLIEASGHEFIVTLPPQTEWLHADLTRMAQVISNLLNNAAKYTPAHGRIQLMAERQETDVIIRVQDNGIGIPAEMLSRIFEMFTQVSATPESPQGGLGIGLTLVKSLVEMHGGSVAAHSAGPGLGSEFTLRIPVLIEKPKTHSPAASNADKKIMPLRARRILVVDDNRDAADSLALFLRLIGHHVHVAYDGMDGIQAAEKFRPQVVLLDIGMPRMNGHDVCIRLRKETWGPGHAADRPHRLGARKRSAPHHGGWIR